MIDGHIEFPYYRLFFDKSNKRSIKLETAVTWSKYNLKMMNIYEESTLNFLICAETLRDGKTIVYIGYVDYVMVKRENLNKLNLSLLKTLTLKEEPVKEIKLVRLKFHQCQWSINDQAILFIYSNSCVVLNWLTFSQ